MARAVAVAGLSLVVVAIGRCLVVLLAIGVVLVLVLLWSLVVPGVVLVISLILRLVLLVGWKVFVCNTRSDVVVPVVKIRSEMMMTKGDDNQCCHELSSTTRVNVVWRQIAQVSPMG